MLAMRGRRANLGRMKRTRSHRGDEGACPKNNSPVLSVENLGVDRDDKKILSGITWTVEKGTHWVILGANGSGKTSLLRTLTAYLTPTTGTIHLLGEEYGDSDWRELRKRIGIVSSSILQMVHEDDFPIEIVIGGAVAEIGLWHRSSAGERSRALRLLGLLGIGSLAERPWMFLSQGERQRVLIARALMPDPALLILDEPCAGLDPVARGRFLRDLEKLARKRNGPSLILVTHHIEEITPSFGHILGLRRGRTVFCGPKAEGLGSPVINAIFGSRFRVAKNGNFYRLEEPAIERPSPRSVQ